MSAVAAGAAVALIAFGAQAAGTPGWRFVAVYPQSMQILSVSASNAANAWAVGNTDFAACNSSLFTSHWNGRKWQTIPEPVGFTGCGIGGAQKDAVAATAGTRAWIFAQRGGDFDASGQIVAVEWTGKSWSAAHKFAGLSSSLLGTAIASGPDDVWGFGSTGRTESTSWAVHFNGKSWSRVPIPVYPGGDSGSAAAGDWIIGTAAARPNTVAVAHWSNGAWRRVSPPKITVPKGDQLGAGLIAAATPSSVWVTVVLSPRFGLVPSATLLLHWNGKAWSKVSLPKGVSPAALATDGHGGLWTTSIRSDVHGELLGTGIYHYSGGHWTHIPAPTKAPLLTAVGNLELIPGTRSILGAAVLFEPDNPSTPLEGAILKYGP